MINECVMIGNLVKDPEKIGNGETLCKFGIAVYGYKADDVSFFTMVAFGKLADNILKYCKKGSKVAISCAPHSRVYENKDKQKVYTVEFLVHTCEFLNTRNAADEPQKKEQTENAADEPQKKEQTENAADESQKKEQTENAADESQKKEQTENYMPF